jgi:hypothetical protein
MAGFVAQQLADWDYWDAATEYAALLKSNTIKDPASEFAVVNYLQRAASASAAVARSGNHSAPQAGVRVQSR